VQQVPQERSAIRGFATPGYARYDAIFVANGGETAFTWSGDWGHVQ